MKRLFAKIKKENTNYDGTSTHLQKDLNLFKTVNKRLVILVGLIIALAVIMVTRLFSMQIINHAYYENLVALKARNPIQIETSRGIIKDRNGKVLTTNTPSNNITYHAPKRLSTDKQFALAQEFINVFKVEGKLNEFESKDLYLYLNNNGNALVTAQEIKNLTNKEINSLKRERVNQEMLATLSDRDKQAFYVNIRMNAQTETSASTIVENVTDKDIAFLAEHQASFPGFSWSTTWSREYVGPEGYEFLVGKVKDIPAEKYDYLIAKGYSPNDKVGASGLEYMYEDHLVGTKTIMRYNPKTQNYEVQSEGKKGNDLILTLDMDLQAKIESQVMATYKRYRAEKRRDKMESLDVVLMDPSTGDLLAVVAIREDSKGNLYNSPESAFLDARPVGSVVKGATVYMGLDQGVIKPDEIIIDTPMYIKGTQPRVSYRPLGPVSDVTALQRSSNIFMFHVAIRMGGGKYVPNQPLLFNKPIEDTFSTMRNYYSQFGLGVNTMVDFPNEQSGYKGSAKNGGLLLELSIGQYDSYTPIQLAQYMATVANKGYRMQPQLVDEVVDSEKGIVVYDTEPTVLNQISNAAALDRVREGFRRCAAGGNCGNIGKLGYSAAGKTGTAQYLHNGSPMINNAFLAFAPYENPKVALSCVNGAASRDNGPGLTNICRSLSAEVIKTYMNHK